MAAPPAATHYSIDLHLYPHLYTDICSMAYVRAAPWPMSCLISARIYACRPPRAYRWTVRYQRLQAQTRARISTGSSRQSRAADHHSSTPKGDGSDPDSDWLAQASSRHLKIISRSRYWRHQDRGVAPFSACSRRLRARQQHRRPAHATRHG